MHLTNPIIVELTQKTDFLECHVNVLTVRLFSVSEPEVRMFSDSL